MDTSFQEAEIIKVESIGEGSRVCLDFVDALAPTEGILLGNTGHGYVFVLAENRSTDTYPARPFRINSGAIHHYALKSEDTTAYLAELQPGQVMSVYNAQGEIRQIAIGRVKVEKRPLMRVVAKVGDTEISATLQEADSVHVYAADEGEKQAITLQTGDRILVKLDQPGRHLGQKIEEDIVEF
ncbi:3-dehydroquinate synthase II [Gracilibacillus salinarum]|uniref:3-dehydroquinate synthase n=1 Tax=Gracilibacillus salinarum TaxID=2932255 RepID=A0ABY4GSU3_9BACI|nr:3-dehydroquinate synthase II [Gracilibacillus salinarum]UOQ87213.1 3-dehydroquinate synthase [Gracilibacillus salinarum]